MAFAAGQHGMSATIVVPLGNSPDKNKPMQALGVELIVYGQDFDQALEYYQALAEQRGL